MTKRLLIGITLRLAVVVVVFMFLRSDCFQNLRFLFSVLFFLYLLPQKLKSSTWKTFPLIEKSCSVSYNCFKNILQEKIDKYNAGKRGYLSPSVEVQDSCYPACKHNQPCFHCSKIRTYRLQLYAFNDGCTSFLFHCFMSTVSSNNN